MYKLIRIMSILLFLGLPVFVGCRIMGREPRVLPHAAPSAEALIEEVLQALAENDRERLKSLALTKDEFCTILWPELPSSKTPNLTCDWVWDSFRPSSLDGLGRSSPAFGGGKPFLTVR